MQALIDAGADVDKQDRNNWSALMWAMTNRHKGIAKLLLDSGASAEAKTSSGRTAFDFVAPDIPGRFTNYWRLKDGQGNAFGHRMWCE